jgi:protein O-mannosyl-transferase
MQNNMPMTEMPKPPRTLTILLGVILVLWTMTVFLPARYFQFVNWDDYDEVVQNPLLHPASAQNLANIWSGPYLRLYAPLSYSAWWLIMRLPDAASDPGLFHLLNILLHLASVALVFSIVRVCVKSPMAAFGGAAIFALHPLQVESVAWVSEMNNLLAAALSLAAIRMYLSFRLTAEKTRWWKYAIASALYLLALFAKPTAVVAPLIAVILDMGFLRSSRQRVLVEIVPWFCLAGIFAWVAHQSQASSGARWLDRPIIAVDALAFYWGKILWPMDLTIDYGRTPARVLNGNLWPGNLAIVAALVVILWLLWRTHRGIALAAMVLLAGVLPVLGFVGFGYQEYSTVADHFVYLGMLGPSLAGAVILAAAPGRWALPLAAALGVGLAVLCAKQLKMWRNNATLVARAMEIDPGSSIANDIVGTELNHAHQPRLAIPYFSAAIARDPQNPFFHYNLADAYYWSGQYEKAIDEFETAIPFFHPPSAKAMNNLGLSYAKAGRTADAIAEFRGILAIDPHNADARYNLHILTGDVPGN